MSLYERILEEAQKEGIEYQPPQAGPRGEELTPELRALQHWTFQGPTHPWSAMAFKSLQRKYPAPYQRFLLQNNGGKGMFGFRQ